MIALGFGGGLQFRMCVASVTATVVPVWTVVASAMARTKWTTVGTAMQIRSPTAIQTAVVYGAEVGHPIHAVLALAFRLTRRTLA